MSGVEGVYDRHSHLPEKRDAFAKLDALIHEMVVCGDTGVSNPA